MRSVKLFRNFLVLLGGLGVSACAGDGRNEPLYALVDSTQRIVAVAGQSQLRGAPPGSGVQAVVGGQEQILMVGERLGTGPILRATPAARPPVESFAAGPAAMLPMTSVELAPLSPPVRTAALPAPEPARRAGSRRVVASEPGSNTRTGRRANPTARSVSRSVM